MTALIAAPRSRRGLLRVGVRILVGAALLGFVLSRVDTSSLTLRWGPGLLLGFAAAVALLVLAQLFSAMRWNVLLGHPEITWATLFRLYLIGNFFSLFLPTSIGGDAVRTTAASRGPATPAEVISSVLLDRLFGVAALATYLVAGAIASRTLFAGVVGAISWNAAPWVVAAGLVGLAVLAAAAWWLRRRFAKLHGALARAALLMRRCVSSPGVSARALLLALVVQAIYIAVWSLLAASLGFDLPLALFLLAVPLVSLAAMAPVTFSGLGVREGAWVLLLAPFGISAADAVSFSLLFFLAFVAVGIIGGAVFVTAGTAIPGSGRSRHSAAGPSTTQPIREQPTSG